MNKHTIHESEVEAKQLPGRAHKMIVGPQNFGPAQHMAFGVADFPAHKHAPPHTHPVEEEILYILTGSGEFYFDGVPEPIRPGMCVYVPPRVEHSINNTSDETLKVVYVFSPPAVQGSYDRKP